MTPVVYLNGRFVPHHRAAVSVDDHGFLYGDGVYETIRVYKGRPFHLPAHLARLRQSLRGLDLRKPPSGRVIGSVVLKLIDKNRLSEAVVRITVTRGVGPRGLDPTLCPVPTVLITATPVRTPPPALYEKGVTAVIARIRRNDPRATPPAIKSTSALNGVLAKAEANRKGAFEAILLSLSGAVAEGTVTNVFAVKAGRIRTPALDGHLLAGVTRDVVLSLARKAGIPVSEGRLTPRDLAAADEVFLTSTVMEVLPVTRLILEDGRRVSVGTGRPGPVARKLRDCYTALNS